MTDDAKKKVGGHDFVRIAARASLSYKTVARAYCGARVSIRTRMQIERAAAQLKLPPPPEEAP